MQKTIRLPYGKQSLPFCCAGERLRGVLESGLESCVPSAPPEELIRHALAHPIGAKPLRELAKGKSKVVLLLSDHTRPVPSRLILPPMLAEIRLGNPEAEITLLVATGCHRACRQEELESKLGTEILAREKIVIHDCDLSPCTLVGTLPGGGECRINSLVTDADLVVSEGFIEPHFFAGFSGGRKSVLPGVASRETVLANHCAAFIDHPAARTGVLEGNPIHTDMLWAARKAGLAFIVNVVLNTRKQVLYAVAGDCERAHEEGCRFLLEHCRVKALPADVVISTNGGYPLDQNIYQAVKGMTAAEATVRKGGIIIMLAQSGDGHGGDAFFHQLADEADIDKTLRLFRSRAAAETQPDQWQTQIMLRVLKRARVIYVSDAPHRMVEQMHMLPAHSLEEAIRKAEELLGTKDYQVTVIPDGVSVIVSE